MPNISVSLNTSNNPPVSINPESQPVSASNSMITWTPSSSGQAFTFTNVVGLPPVVFTNKQISNGQISIMDGGQSGIYPYAIVVTSNGVQYSSQPSQPDPTNQAVGPHIHNN
ncbi:MAG: hypothetical protein JSS21_05060 [Proteobacteria bacterium]|nr:hypothetical protein [Pseudomonadota bacterium]